MYLKVTDMIGSISSVPQLTMRDSTVQKMYKTADGQTKIVNYYYEVSIYNRMGKVQTVTNAHTITYLV